MKALGIALIAALSSCVAAPASAAAQGIAQNLVCDTAAETRKILHGLGRVSIGYGIAGNDGVVEIYVNKDGGWNAILFLPDGRACLLGGGSDWTFVEQPWSKEGVDG